jgi:hypothetical protein
MATTYRTDLIAPGDLAAYQAKHPVGGRIIFPDLNNAGKSIAYVIEEVRIAEAGNHPETGDPVKCVTLVLKN